jgi:hypothetical protein
MASIELTASRPIDGALEHFLSYPYLLTWHESEHIKLWRFSDDSAGLNFVAELSEYTERPIGNRNIIIDENQGILIIPGIDHEDDSEVIHLFRVYSLSDGHIIRTCPVYGELQEGFTPYTNGHVLANVRVDWGDEFRAPHKEIILCDVAGDEWVVASLSLPDYLSDHEDRRCRLHGGFQPVLFRGNGDVIATTTDYMSPLEVLLYRGPIDYRQQPDTSLKLEPAFRESFDIASSRSASLNDDCFVLYVHEINRVSLQRKWESCTTIHAINAEHMTVLWTAEPIWGYIYYVEHVSSLQVLVCFGKRDLTNENQGFEHWLTFVGVIDTRNGALLTLDTTDHSMGQSSICAARLSNDAQHPDIVIIFDNGSVSVHDLQSFIKNGFDRVGDSIRLTSMFLGQVPFPWTSVGRRCIVALVEAGEGENRNRSVQYVQW